MKLRILTPIILAITTQFCLADLVMVQKLESPMQSGEMTLKVKGTKIRTDMAGQMSSIMDGSTGDIITLMHGQKMYMKMSGSSIKSIADKMRKTTGEQTKGETPKLVPNGQKQNINGFDTEGYTWTTGGMKITYWIAKSHPQYKQLLAAMDTMQKNQSDATGGLTPKMSDFPGVPIRTEMDVNGQKITTTLISTKEEPVSDSEFATPADYQEMKMPAMPATGVPTE